MESEGSGFFSGSDNEVVSSAAVFTNKKGAITGQYIACTAVTRVSIYSLTLPNDKHQKLFDPIYMVQLAYHLPTLSLQHELLRVNQHHNLLKQGTTTTTWKKKVVSIAYTDKHGQRRR